MRSLLALHGNVFVLWVPRLCNQAAHILAKWSLSCNFFGSFGYGFYLDCLSSVVVRESSRVLWFVSSSLIKCSVRQKKKKINASITELLQSLSLSLSLPLL